MSLRRRPWITSSIGLLVLGLCGTAEAQSCPSGSYPCGSNYCTPDDGVCCASVGNPDRYCPSGTRCLYEGGCEEIGGSSGGSGGSGSGGSGGSSGGSCPAGTYPCGSNYCTPNDGVCCASVGRPDSYCPSGTTCLPGDGCSSDGTGSTGGTGGTTSGGTIGSGGGSDGSYGATSGSGGSTSGSGGSTLSVPGCADYYDEGYQEFQVETQCQSAYVYACAQDPRGVTASCDILEAWGGSSLAKCPYCNGVDPSTGGGDDSSFSDSSDSSDSGSCAVARTGQRDSGMAALLAVLGAGLFIGRRRRAR